MITRIALIWSGLWAAAALAFFVFLHFGAGAEPANQFLTGYLVELSLSVDNVLVFAVIFDHFQFDPRRQRQVLFWGVAGAIVLRGLFILAGAHALHRLHWLVDVFGVLLVLGAARILSSQLPGRAVDPEKKLGVRLIRFLAPPARHGVASRFLLVLVVVEVTDLIFAFDSLPAVLAITPHPGIAFASNLFAVAGLRSLYFALIGVRKQLRFVETGLAVILLLVGGRILVARWIEIGTGASLAAVGVVLAAVAVANLRARKNPA